MIEMYSEYLSQWFIQEMHLSCHISVLSEFWVNVTNNVRTMNLIPVTYFGNHACLMEGAP